MSEAVTGRVLGRGGGGVIAVARVKYNCTHLCCRVVHWCAHHGNVPQGICVVWHKWGKKNQNVRILGRLLKIPLFLEMVCVPQAFKASASASIFSQINYTKWNGHMTILSK